MQADEAPNDISLSQIMNMGSAANFKRETLWDSVKNFNSTLANFDVREIETIVWLL